MVIIPAIDLRAGKVVRLTQGDYEAQVTYSDSPQEIAQQYYEQGCSRIHIVDLDGAKSGKPTQMPILELLASKIPAELQVGGGIRDPRTIERYLSMGIKRVILGTKACLDNAFLKECLQAFSDTVIVGADAKDGFLAVDGWTRITEMRTESLLEQVSLWGGKEIIYTDIARDGMLAGPNFESFERVLNLTDLGIIASGGVSSISDIKRFLDFKTDKIIGVIIGKAIYEQKICLKEANQLCSM